MKWKTCLLGAALVALLAAGSAYGTTWADHFANWTGKDATAVSSYTDTNGNNPNTYNVPAGVALTDYLTQVDGTIAKFYDPPGGSGVRWRFQTMLPTSMKGTNGIGVAWKMNIYDDRNYNRGPFHIAITDNGDKATAQLGTGVPYNNYFLIKSSLVGTDIQYTVRPVRNGGGTQVGVEAYALPNLNQLLNSWHVWTVTAKVFPPEEFPVGSGLMKQFCYWNMWLDGTQIFFTAPGGVPDANGTWGTAVGPDGKTYSYRWWSEQWDAPPLVEMADNGNDNYQNYGFDWVTYRDDDNAYFDGAPPLVACDGGVTPGGSNNSTAVRAMAAQPASFDYTVFNFGTDPLSYTVATTDAAGNPQAYDWLSVSGAGGPIASGGNEPVTASIINTDLAPGTYPGYITVTRTCTPTAKYIRQVNLTVIGCRMQLDPSFDLYRAVATPKEQPAPVVFNVTNTGYGTFGYTVTKTPDDTTTAWLNLSKVGSSEPLTYLQTDPVTVTFNRTGLADGIYSCQLTFTPTCDSSPNAGVQTRKVYLSVRGASNPKQWFSAEFQDIQGTDLSLTTGLYAYPRIWDQPTPFTVGANPIPGAADFYTQGSIEGKMETLKFYYKQGPNWARGPIETDLPLNANYEPAKGMAFAWRMRTGDYYGIGRGPFLVWFPSADPANPFKLYFSIHSGNDLRVQKMCCGNPGETLTGVNNVILDKKISDPLSDPNDPESPRIPTYHLWSASGCYDAAFNATYSYWNLYLELRDANDQPYMKQIMFTGANGSVAGPGGKTYSFRTDLKETTTAQAGFAMGERANSGAETNWDFEFDYVRVITLDVAGCPFWDGSQGFGIAWPDADEDGDVDQSDFAVIQNCFSGPNSDPFWPGLAPGCNRYDRDLDGDLDSLDVNDFEDCATGPGILLDETNLPAGCGL